MTASAIETEQERVKVRADAREQEIKCLHLSLPGIIVRMRAAIEIWLGCGAFDM